MTTPDPAGNGSKRLRAGSESGSRTDADPGSQPAADLAPEPGWEPGSTAGGSDWPDEEPTSHPSGVPSTGAARGPEPGAGDPLTLAAPDGELPAGVADPRGETPAGMADPGEEPPAGAPHLDEEPSGGTVAGAWGAGPHGYPPIPAMPVEPPPTLADRASGSSPEETPTAAHAAIAGEPRPPDWSTPETPAIAPPLHGSAAPGPPPSKPPAVPPPGPPAGPPYPPTDGPAPAPGPEPPPRRRTLPLVIALTAALLICCCGAVVGGVGAVGAVYGHFSDRGRRIVGLNESARDGNLEFRVATIKCGVPRVGDQFVSQTAAGQFCLVDLTVRNAGGRPATFDDSLQRAYGPGDRQFGVDQTATMIVNAAQPLFLAPINPGNRVPAILVYDIPADGRLVRLLLHATADSRGVLVKV